MITFNELQYNSLEIFVKYFLPSETKLSMINHERKLDYLKSLFEDIIFLFDEKKYDDLYYTNIQKTTSLIQINYYQVIKQQFTDIGTNFPNKAEDYFLTLDLENNVDEMRLEKMEILLRKLDSSETFNVSKIKDEESSYCEKEQEELYKRLNENIQSFVNIYQGYYLKAYDKYKEKKLHAPTPFILEFFNFLTHYTYIVMYFKTYNKFNKYMQKNLEKANGHLERGILDIFKITIIILDKNNQINTKENFQELLRLRQGEVNKISTPIDKRLSDYQGFIDNSLKF